MPATRTKPTTTRQAQRGRKGSTRMATDAPAKPQKPAETPQEAGSLLPTLLHGDSLVQEEIRAAAELGRQIADLQEKVGENRETLRLLDKRGKLSEKQGSWLDDFYPLKTKGERRSADDVKRSREVRAATIGVSEDKAGDN